MLQINLVSQITRLVGNINCAVLHEKDLNPPREYYKDLNQAAKSPIFTLTVFPRIYKLNTHSRGSDQSASLRRLL